jgi:rfaE bifunctional protein nucleotidyltransferase chain/domain
MRVFCICVLCTLMVFIGALYWGSAPLGRKGMNLGEVVTEEQLLTFREAERRAGRRVAFTNGCFDLLHPGHVRCLEQARSLGDCLIVAINSDASVRALKGSGRPVIPAEERAEILAALEAVDRVVIFDEPTPARLIARLLPDVLVKGGDWGRDEIVGRGEVEGAGGSVVSVEVEPGYSSTELLGRIQNSSQ